MPFLSGFSSTGMDAKGSRARLDSGIGTAGDQDDGHFQFPGMQGFDDGEAVDVGHMDIDDRASSGIDAVAGGQEFRTRREGLHGEATRGEE